MSLFKEVIEWKDKIAIGKKEMNKNTHKSEKLGEELEDLRGSKEEDAYVNNCRFPKFHYLLHVLDQVENYGSAQNFDGGSCESNHKYLTKSPGMRTQGRMNTFDYQTAFNLSAKIVLDRACRKLNITATFGVSMNFNSTCDDETSAFFSSDDETSREGTDVFDVCTAKTGVSINKCSSHFSLVSVDGDAMIKWKTGLVKPKSRYPRIATDWIQRNIIVNGWEDSTITGFTCLDFDGSIVRAHPSYRRGDPWFDYVNVKWTEDENWYICPAKVCMSLEIVNQPEYMNGKYALVHSTAVYGKQYKPSKKARKLWKDRGESPIFQFWDMEPVCQLAHIDTINDIAFVYPDFSDDDMTVKTGFVIEVKPIEEWIDLHNYAEV